MEHNVLDLKQALTARSHTATLEELQSRGRRSVRVIRAEDVAQMIQAAVSQAIAASGMVSPQEVEELEQRSREQFNALLERRQSEISELRQAADELLKTREQGAAVAAENAAMRAERDGFAAEVRELRDECGGLRRERDEAAGRLRHAEVQREQAVAQLRKSEVQCADALERVRALESQLAKAQAETPATVAGGVNVDLVYRLMGEIAELKAKSALTAPTPQPAPAPAASSAAATADALAGALQQLTTTFTAKLESLGRKMGVSSAVQADAPSLTNLFKHEEGQKLESNMQNLTVKAKSATGIAANLERLKKLKGGA